MVFFAVSRCAFDAPSVQSNIGVCERLKVIDQRGHDRIQMVLLHLFVHKGNQAVRE